MLLNSGVEEEWESPGLQGDPTSPSLRRSVLNIHWKDWYWSWNSNTLDVKNWLVGKDPDAGKIWRPEEKGMTEDEMVGWHHWWTWGWASSSTWLWTGKSGMLQSTASQSRIQLSDWTDYQSCFLYYFKNFNNILFNYILHIKRKNKTCKFQVNRGTAAS